jgi:dTDP-4-dehydrorhamnose reductase
MTAFLARRPVYTRMATEKFLKTTGLSTRPWRDAVRDFVKKKYERQ